jgi:NAD(P)H-hydrate epimerase
MDLTVLPLLSAGRARAADAAAIAAGDTAEVLMARAAGHLARGVIAAAGRGAGLRVDLVVGRGDNGGDGWAAAPLLAGRGAHVRVIAPDGTDAPTSDAAALARARWLARGGTVRTGAVMPHLVDPSGRARADVVVDCLLGTGASGALRGTVAEAAAAVHAARSGGALVVACDVPTGVGADDGRTADGAVAADVTITFGALKRGLLLAPGSTHAGRVVLGRIGPHFAEAAAVPTAHALEGEDATRWWRLTAAGARPSAPDPLTEKRRRGVVLIVAGKVGTAGAALLAGRGALAAGAGLVTLAVPEPVRAEVAAMHPALMTVGLPAGADGGLHADAVHALPLDGVDAVVAGPGLGTGPGAAEVVAALRARCPRLVLDADALNVHRDAPDTLAEHARAEGSVLVLTPHERELDRLAGPGAFADRASRVPELAARWAAHVVAKGAGTMSAAPDGTVHVSPFAVPALATGGTGDVLAGMLGAALAALGPRADVARAIARTVWWHAAAGRIAGDRSGARIDATAVLAALPDLFAHLAPGIASVRSIDPSTPWRDPGPSGHLALDTLLDVAGAAA